MTDRLPEIEGFRVLRQVGEGGIGVVYLAEPAEAPSSVVALKVLHERVDMREGDVRRLVREARVGQALRHAHILPIREIRRHGRAHVLVMEYVQGGPLRPWRAEQGASELGRQLLALASIADALEYAHSRGVVHRDVKPSNILVREDGHPFLIDFGLARTIAVDSTLTASGAILGTPGYLAPEQLIGGATLDARGDVYALGVTLFEIVTGALPFRARSLPELFEQIARAEPPRLPDSIPHARALDGIVRRAMEKRPADRYPSAAELRDDLRRAARGLKPRSGGASLWVKRELRRLNRQRTRIALGAAALLGVLAVGLLLGLRAQVRAGERRDLLQRGYELLDRGNLDETLETFAQVDELGGYEGQLAKAQALAEFQQWERAAAEIRGAREHGYAFGGDQPSAEDLLLRALLDCAEHRYESAEKGLEHALELDPDLYRAYLVQARLYVRHERRSEARAALEACRRNLKELNPRHTAVAAQIHVLDGKHAQAIQELETLAAAPNPPSWVYPLLGYAHLAAHDEGQGLKSDLQGALAAFSKAVELEPADGHSWSLLALARYHEGERELAHSCAERALACDSSLEAANLLLTALAAERGDWDAAERYAQAFASETALAQVAKRVLAQVAFVQGTRSFQTERYAEARASFRRCVELLPEHLAGWFQLGEVQRMSHENAEALRAYGQSLELIERWQTPAAAWEPWARVCARVARENRADVCVGILAATGALEGADAEVVARATLALSELRAARSASTHLPDATALNLAEALATTRVDTLRDCSWAWELIEAGDLYAVYENQPAALEGLARIEASCPP